MKQDKLYLGINFVIFILTGIMFVQKYLFIIPNINWQFVRKIVGFISIVIIVHIIKGFRLWFALYGKEIPFSDYLIQYCKTVSISVIIPFKLGDLFRAYCFGHLSESYLAGILIILFDRFCDTLALVILIMLLSIVIQYPIPQIFYIFFIFLICVISCYWIFPAIYQYWKQYFLLAKASKRKMHALKLLHKMNNVYQELTLIVKGRSLILIILSILAWSIEIGGIGWMVNNLEAPLDHAFVFNYLTAALTGQPFNYLQQFILITIIVMFTSYMILRCRKQIKKQVNK